MVPYPGAVLPGSARRNGDRHMDKLAAEAWLVPQSTQMGIGTGDDAGHLRVMTAPGTEPAFPPVRQAVFADLVDTPSNGETGDPDPVPVNFPPRLGEVAEPHDGGFLPGAWNPDPGPARSDRFRQV